DRNRSHWSTSKTPSYTKSVSWQHHPPLKDYSATVITCEKRHPKDNVPDILWQNYVLPEVPGIMFYMEITHLRKNALFFNGLDKPIFICTMPE
ncbi:hypothetical protein R1K39_24095, partial [Klebsiella sp. 105384]